MGLSRTLIKSIQKYIKINIYYIHTHSKIKQILKKSITSYCATMTVHSHFNSTTILFHLLEVQLLTDKDVCTRTKPSVKKCAQHRDPLAFFLFCCYMYIYTITAYVRDKFKIYTFLAENKINKTQTCINIYNTPKLCGGLHLIN